MISEFLADGPSPTAALVLEVRHARRAVEVSDRHDDADAAADALRSRAELARRSVEDAR